MQERGDKIIYTNLLFSPALLIDCCVFDAFASWQKGGTLTISMPVSRLSSEYILILQKNGTGSVFTNQGDDLHSRQSSVAWGRGRCVRFSTIGGAMAVSVLSTTDVNRNFLRMILCHC